MPLILDKKTKEKFDSKFYNKSYIPELLQYFPREQDKIENLNPYSSFVLKQAKDYILNYYKPERLIIHSIITVHKKIEVHTLQLGHAIVDVVDIFTASSSGFFNIRMIPPHAMEKGKIIKNVDAFINHCYNKMNLIRDFEQLSYKYKNKDVFYVKDNQIDVLMQIYDYIENVDRSDFILLCEELSRLKHLDHDCRNIRITRREDFIYSRHNPALTYFKCTNVDKMIISPKTNNHYFIGVSFDFDTKYFNNDNLLGNINS